MGKRVAAREIVFTFSSPQMLRVSSETNDKLHADIHAILTRTASCSTLDVQVFAIGPSSRKMLHEICRDAPIRLSLVVQVKSVRHSCCCQLTGVLS